MKVYVVVSQVYEEVYIGGVYSSLDKAKDSVRGNWRVPAEEYRLRWEPTIVAENKNWAIFEEELDGSRLEHN